MKITWDQGMKKLATFLERAPKDVRNRAAAAAYREAETMMTLSQSRFVPVDLGTLKGSGHVKPPRVGRWTVSVTLGYGGAASAYALIQHEAMHFRHTVGGPKYLERPVKMRRQQFIDAMAKAIREAT